MDSPKKMKCYCSRCNRSTNHEIMGEAYNEFQIDEDYMWARDTYRVVRCCGCENVSFNIESESSENIRLGEYGEEELYSEFKSYPIDEGDVHKF